MLSLTAVHHQIARGDREIDSTVTVVVDNAALADPSMLTDLAAHSANLHACLVLLDGDVRGWPPTPSGPMLALLHRDLPWSVSLSVEDATPASKRCQPDLDPLLDQAKRSDPRLSPRNISDALVERERLRRLHASSSRVDASIWCTVDRRGHAGRETDIPLGLGLDGV